MRQDRRSRARDRLLCDTSFEESLLGFTLAQQLLQCRAENARQQIGREILHLAADDDQSLGCRVVSMMILSSDPRDLPAELLGEQPGMIVSQQVVLEDGECRDFKWRLADRDGVAAGPALLLTGTAIIVLAGNCVARAAAAALDEAGQQVLATLLSDRRDAEVGVLAAFDLRMHDVPECIVDDAEGGNGYFDPFRPVA